MEVQFTPSRKSGWVRLPAWRGCAARLVQDAALLLIEDDRRFREGVRKGSSRRTRGCSIDEAEMDAASPDAEASDASALNPGCGGRPGIYRRLSSPASSVVCTINILEIYQTILTLRSTPIAAAPDGKKNPRAGPAALALYRGISREG